MRLRPTGRDYLLGLLAGVGLTGFAMSLGVLLNATDLWGSGIWGKALVVIGAPFGILFLFGIFWAPIAEAYRQGRAER